MTGRVWLVAGALAGAALAAVSLVRRPAVAALPADAVAVVDGAVIRRADYERALAAVTADRRVVDADVRRRVLDRMIEEELLVQRGVELGLASRDPRVRNDLAAAVIELVTARAGEDAPPTDAELRAFYAEHAGLFAEPAAVRLEHTWEGEGAAVPLPDGLLPPSAIERYLGPTVARAALELRVGETSAPIRTASGTHVIRVVERRPAAPRPYEAVRELVAAEYQRRAGERALRRFFDERRAAVDVIVVGDRP